MEDRTLLWKYYKLVRIDLASQSQGYKHQLVPRAQRFFYEMFPEFEGREYISGDRDRKIQTQLLSSLWGKASTPEALIEALSVSGEGICLRCYVSHYILKAAQNRAKNRCWERKPFSLRELLPLVLTDDGRSLASFQNQARFFRPKEFFHALQIFQQYLKYEPSSKRSLAAYAVQMTQSSDVITNFLREHGRYTQSEWGILNATTPNKLTEILREFYYWNDSEIQRACAILKSYHQIYRRDRRGKYGTCPAPSDMQQQRIIQDLQERFQRKISPESLIEELRAIAKCLQEYSISSRNPMLRSLSLDAPLSGTEIPLSDTIADPNTINNPEREEDAKLRSQWEELLDQQLIDCLDRGIDRGFSDVINALRGQATNLAPVIKSAFWLLYCEGLSQSATASRLKITQSQVSRRIKPLANKLFCQVRQRTQECLLRCILNKVKELGTIENPEDLGYFDNLVHQVEIFFNEKVFPPSEAELRDARTRSANSFLYFQRLGIYLARYQETE